jgi:hypothetical protein
MALHLLKLCVGADSIDDLESFIRRRLAQKRRTGEPVEYHHTTRMVPRRREELIDGGSLYWVIRGQVAARQALRDVQPFIDPQGISRCRLLLDPNVVAVIPRPCRPFQGWRYLNTSDAPADIDRAGGDVAIMPEALRRQLRELGLI